MERLEILKGSPNIHFIYDTGKSEFLYFDSNMYTSKGRLPTVDELIATIHPEGIMDLKKMYVKITNGEFTGSCIVQLQHEEEARWVRITPILIKAQTESYLTGCIEDITASVVNLQTISKYANKKNSMLNLMSHDLRGPLAIANTLTKELHSRVSDKSLVSMSETVMTILQQSIDLITDLIMREFLEAVEVNLVKTKINIAKKSSDYMEEYQKAEKLTNRKFKFSCNKKELFLDIDESKFMQVYNNLMSNSLKFTKPGGTIELAITEEDSKVCFSFADDGIGIPAKFQNTLFEKFSAGGRVGLNGEPTLGLGLSIVKKIIEWHDGKIRVESAEGSGARFFFEIPKK